MNEELKQKLVESLDKVQDYVEATEEFVSAQAPLVVQEVLTLGRVESVWNVLWPGIIWFIATVIATTLIRRALGIFANKILTPDMTDNNGEPTLIAGVISAVFAIVFFLIAMGQVEDMLEPWLAPRVYLLHELGKLL